MNRLLTGILFIFILTGTGGLSGQPVQISGYVITADSGKAVPFASVIPLGTGRGVFTNYIGYFSLLIDRRDTLEIRALGFSNQLFSLPGEFSGNYFSGNISLAPIAYELSEIKFNPWAYEQVLAKAKNLPLPGAGNVSLSDPLIGSDYFAPRMGAGLVFAGPFTALYNKFSRKGREMERLRELLQNGDGATTAARKLTPELIKDVTGLNYDDIQDFVRYCQLGTDFVRDATMYDLMVAIDHCFSQFIVAFPELAPSKDKEENPDNGVVEPKEE
jgi:hypothetical protein